MLKGLRYFLLFLLAGGCLEPYTFVVKDEDPRLVVEGSISDKSFNETLEYPSDGRYFTVKLSLTGDVTNTRRTPVSKAVVELHSSTGGVWTYTQKETGTFYLLDDNFRAESGTSYKLHITGPDDAIYESAWEALPPVTGPPMGEIAFVETEKQIYIMEALNWMLRDIQVVQTQVNIPVNTAAQPVYYRWTFSPTWIYKAPLSSVVDPGYICWATDPNYLSTFELQKDISGGYKRDLFLLRTIRNERIFEKLSVLVVQHSLTENFYEFWREMKEQNENTALMDTPPYNLKTNFSSTNSSKPVSGYFGVVSEQAKRWYFSRSELSYTVANMLREDCLQNFGGPPAPECLDCRAYSFGTATTKKPDWWE